MSTAPLQETWTAEAIAALVAEFDACTLPHERWKHREHLLVCFWYVHRHGRERALELLREGIQNLNRAHGVETTPNRGYHESITVFWMWAMADFFARTDHNRPLEVQAADMLAEFADKAYILKYYSRERIMSLDARYGWVEPDLQALT